MKTILVPIDGSENSQRALEKAKEIAVPLGSKVILLNIVNVRSAVSYYHNNIRLTQNSAALDWPTIAKKARTDSKDLLEKSKLLLEGVEVETVTYDEPGVEIAHAITEYAKDHGADMIVMGSNGMGSLGRRIYMGSITTRVLHTTALPVLVVQ